MGHVSYSQAQFRARQVMSVLPTKGWRQMNQIDVLLVRHLNLSLKKPLPELFPDGPLMAASNDQHLIAG